MSYYQHSNPDWRQALSAGNAFASWEPPAWTIPNAAAGTEMQSPGATTTTKGAMKTKIDTPNTVAEDTPEPESEPESEAWHADNEADGLTPGSRLGSAAVRRTLATPGNETNSNTVAPAAATTTTTSDMDADMDDDDPSYIDAVARGPLPRRLPQAQEPPCAYTALRADQRLRLHRTRVRRCAPRRAPAHLAQAGERNVFRPYSFLGPRTHAKRVKLFCVVPPLVEAITPLTPAEAAFLCKLQARTAMLLHDAPYGLAGNDVRGSVFGSLPAYAGYPSTERPLAAAADEAVEDMRTRGA